jgi:hypothetical protein
VRAWSQRSDLKVNPFSTVQKLKERMIPAARKAELSLLTCVGYQHLPDLGWEWQVLARIRRHYKLSLVPKWDPEGSKGSCENTPRGPSPAESSQACPASTAASAVAAPAPTMRPPAVLKSGHALAKDFILDACASLASEERCLCPVQHAHCSKRPEGSDLPCS